MQLSLIWVLFGIKGIVYALGNDYSERHDEVGINYESTHGRWIPRSIAMPARLSNASQANIQQARDTLTAILPKMEAMNTDRINNPARNRYSTRGTSLAGGENAAKPLMVITNELADAAALLDEADAFGGTLNGTWFGVNNTKLVGPTRDPLNSPFWMSVITRQGSWPWGNNPSNFTVFRDVIKYSAIRDSAALNY
ncbi:hypothetical protein N431DRAFT_444439 [Stipitochalara longipes BDJ]|nr:hypothetical protein N431DRAFT_444439 [Stipitochalara longipes BDJ]